MAATGSAAPAEALHPEDFYELLDVSGTASLEEIKRAYRQQALKWHPDKQDAANRQFAEERFKLVSEAYQVLSNPQKRADYDQFGKEGARGMRPPTGGGGFGGARPGGDSGGAPPPEFGGSGFGSPGTQFVFTRSGPDGTFTRTSSGPGMGGHPFFGGGPARDPFDLFREVFGEFERAFQGMPGRPGGSPGPGVWPGHPHCGGMGQPAVPVLRRVSRPVPGHGPFPGTPGPFPDPRGVAADDEELRRVLESSRREDEMRQQRRLEEMQPEAMDEDEALQEALRRSREESDLDAAIRASMRASSA